MMKRLLRLAGFGLVCVLCPSVQADTLGLLDGRSASPKAPGAKSIEVGYQTSEDDDGTEITTLAGRLNFQYSSTIGLYVDYGQISFEGDFVENDGDAYGIGIRYALSNQRFAPSLDVAVRASYHSATVDFADNLESDLTEIAAAVHVSSKQAFFSTWSWYAVLSYQQGDVTFSDDSLAGLETDSTDTGYGVGVFSPFGGGEAYIGVENIGDLYLGLGYRHFLGGAR